MMSDLVSLDRLASGCGPALVTLCGQDGEVGSDHLQAAVKARKVMHVDDQNIQA